MGITKVSALISYNYDVSRPSLRVSRGYITSSATTMYLEVKLETWYTNGSITTKAPNVFGYNNGDGYAFAQYTSPTSTWVTQITGNFVHGGSYHTKTKVFPG